MSAEPRRAAIPNANNPRLVRRVVGWIARGVRSSRGLQEVLGLELRTVQYYLNAAEWLGLVEAGPDRLLTPLGLGVAFSDDPGRAYARAVWAQPFVAQLMTGRGRELPPVEDVVVAIARAEPDLAPATVRRRASSVRSLVAPALGPRRRPAPRPEQLDLPLAPRAPGPPPRLDPGVAADADPDVYRAVYGALLDHGELTLGQLRALLDRAGVSELPIGGYVRLAEERGDARKEGERLVIPPGGVHRRDVVRSTASIILSHARYRQWLDDRRAAAEGDRHAEIRCDQVAARFRAWDRRLLGRALDPGTLDADLGRVLLDRSVDSFPLTGDGGTPPAPVEAPFLDAWEQGGLLLALPPSLEVLRGGLAAVNARFQAARQGHAEVGLPDVSTRPVRVHGGLLHPGEPRPRSVPDQISLRLRLLMNAPYPALLAGVLLLHREAPEQLAVRRLRGTWHITRRGRPLGPVLPLFDAFAAHRGWIPCRRPSGGLPLDDLLAGLEAVGLLHLVERTVVLAERLFLRLRTAPEQMEVHHRLRPLADALEGWLGGLEPETRDERGGPS
jgi:hypothetical protein